MTEQIPIQKRIEVAIAQNPDDPYITGELQDLLQDCSKEIERLKAILRSCVHGPEVVDIGGEMLWLHLPNKGDMSFRDIKASISGEAK